MSVLKNRVPISMTALLQAIEAGEPLSDDLCLYSADDADEITPQLVCYLDAGPDIIDDTEVYSEFVVSHGLTLLYDGQQFNDVLYSLALKDASASVALKIRALNFYLDNDNFLSLDF